MNFIFEDEKEDENNNFQNESLIASNSISKKTVDISKRLNNIFSVDEEIEATTENGKGIKSDNNNTKKNSTNILDRAKPEKNKIVTNNKTSNDSSAASSLLAKDLLLINKQDTLNNLLNTNTGKITSTNTNDIAMNDKSHNISNNSNSMKNLNNKQIPEKNLNTIFEFENNSIIKPTEKGTAKPDLNKLNKLFLAEEQDELDFKNINFKKEEQKILNPAKTLHTSSEIIKNINNLYNCHNSSSKQEIDNKNNISDYNAVDSIKKVHLNKKITTNFLDNDDEENEYDRINEFQKKNYVSKDKNIINENKNEIYSPPKGADKAYEIKAPPIIQEPIKIQKNNNQDTFTKESLAIKSQTIQKAYQSVQPMANIDPLTVENIPSMKENTGPAVKKKSIKNFNDPLSMIKSTVQNKNKDINIIKTGTENPLNENKLPSKMPTLVENKEELAEQNYNNNNKINNNDIDNEKIQQQESQKKNGVIQHVTETPIIKETKNVTHNANESNENDKPIDIKGPGKVSDISRV